MRTGVTRLVTISVPTTVFREMEEDRKRLHLSRSRYITLALHERLARRGTPPEAPEYYTRPWTDRRAP